MNKNLGSQIPIQNHRLPQTQKAEINSQVYKLLRNNLIERNQSNYNNPLILVPN